MKINFKKTILILVAFTSLVSCYKITDNDLINPNLPQLTTANIDLYLNTVEINFASFYSNTHKFGGELTRMQNWRGPSYQQPADMTPTSFNDMWGDAYYTLNAIDLMIPLALSNKKTVIAGIGYALKAYIWGTLVDYYDSIPFEQALQGANNFNPNKSSGQFVYNKVITYLDSCVTLMGLSTGYDVAVLYDNFYSGNRDNWRKLAKTLKLKYLLQQRLINPAVATPIQALLTENDLITTTAQDFNFKYGINLNAPNSRHPDYSGNYRAGLAPGAYLSNYYLWTVIAEKGLKSSGGSWDAADNLITALEIDPRRRYYFYRQRINYGNVDLMTASCSESPKPGWFTDQTIPFCLPASTGGYWGRDHGDFSGTPPDGDYRTTYGLYPAGGRFDDNSAVSVRTATGGGNSLSTQGAGIHPIWNSEFTEFVKAELLLLGGQNALARTSLEAAVRRSISKVQGFAASVGYSLTTPNISRADSVYLRNGVTQIKTYVDTVLARFDRGGSDVNALMDVIQKEYYIALWGNGIEAYNNYRRTGFPSNFQPNISNDEPANGFIRSFYYPANYAFRNANFSGQKKYGVGGSKVFWDPGVIILK